MKIKKVRDRKQEKEFYQAGRLLFLVFFILAPAWKLFGISMKLPPCLFHKWTGFYCPGCGGTRAIRELLQGHVMNSFFYHPVVVYGSVLYIWFMISHTVEYVSKGKFRIGMPYTDKYLYIAAGIILLQWVIKNMVKLIWGVGII